MYLYIRMWDTIKSLLHWFLCCCSQCHGSVVVVGGFVTLSELIVAISEYPQSNGTICKYTVASVGNCDILRKRYYTYMYTDTDTNTEICSCALCRVQILFNNQLVLFCNYDTAVVGWPAWSLIHCFVSSNASFEAYEPSINVHLVWNRNQIFDIYIMSLFLCHLCTFVGWLASCMPQPRQMVAIDCANHESFDSCHIRNKAEEIVRHEHKL